VKRQPFWPHQPEHLWIGYPHKTLDALTKAVYLWEASNYVHQLFVINLEARRSDFWQMTLHHYVTLALIGGSYVCCFNRVGLVVLLLLDPSDVLLALAKLLKYMGWQTVCDIMFGLFMMTWTVLRHAMFLWVLWLCYNDAPRLINYTSTPSLESGNVFTPFTYVVFIGLLIVLQFILLIWFVMIIKVAIRVLTAKGAVDSRSDSEDD